MVKVIAALTRRQVGMPPFFVTSQAGPPRFFLTAEQHEGNVPREHELKNVYWGIGAQEFP